MLYYKHKKYPLSIWFFGFRCKYPALSRVFFSLPDIMLCRFVAILTCIVAALPYFFFH